MCIVTFSTRISVMLPPSVHSSLMPSRQILRIVQLEITTPEISPMDFNPMRMPAQTEVNAQSEICTSCTGRPLDCRQRLSSVPSI